MGIADSRYIPFMAGDWRLRARMEGSGEKVRHMAWVPSGQHLAVVFADGSLRAWDLQSGEPYLEFEDQEAGGTQVAWSPDGRFVATVSRDAKVRILDARTGCVTRIIETEALSCSNLVWTSRSRSIVTALRRGAYPQQDLVIQKWDSGSGRLLRSMDSPEWDQAFVAMSADRRFLALSLRSGKIQVWDLASCRKVATIPGEHGVIFGVALSADLKTLAMSFDGGVIGLWDVKRSAPLRKVNMHEAPAYSLAFSSDGFLLASKSKDCTVCLTRCDTWEEVARRKEESIAGEEPELAFHPHYPWLATLGERNSSVYVWEIDFEAFRLRESNRKISILFLSAAPVNYGTPLRLDEELRKIREQIVSAPLRDHISLVSRVALRLEDLSQALLQESPRIVHFSGHGVDSGEICLENEGGKMQAVDPDILAELFRYFAANPVECALLNACHSERQARAVAGHIKYVIGMSEAIADSLAIAFSVGFYQGLGEGRSIENSYLLGCVQMEAQWKGGSGRKDTRDLKAPRAEKIVQPPPRPVLFKRGSPVEVAMRQG